jgi:hypothetical protein
LNADGGLQLGIDPLSAPPAVYLSTEAIKTPDLPGIDLGVMPKPDGGNMPTDKPNAWQPGDINNFYWGRNDIPNSQDIFNNGKSGGKNANDLDPSTVGKNLLGLTYPGGNNPRTYAGNYTYSYVPKRLSEYPAIGHDRRYDNLGISGAKGLLTDTRAIGADLRFVTEEFTIALSPLSDPVSQIQAYTLGVGLGLLILPKTIYEFSQPNGQGIINSILWYNVSNVGVTNNPSTDNQ